MVEQLPIHREHVIGLAVIARDPIAVHLRRPIWATRVEGRLLVLRRWAGTEHLAGARLIEADGRIDRSNRLQQVQCAYASCFCRIQGLVE